MEIINIYSYFKFISIYLAITCVPSAHSGQKTAPGPFLTGGKKKMVLSIFVGSGNWTQVPCKGLKCF